MSKIMLWPDIYREQGHWLPTVNLAKSLQDGGHTVSFMGIPDCESIVSPYKATFHTVLADLYPLGHTANDKLEPVGQRWKPHHLMKLARGELDSLFTGANKPDVLVVGYFAGLEGAIISRKYNIPLVVITTYLRHPDEDPTIFALSKLEYMPDAQVTKLIETVTGDPNMTPDDFVQPIEKAKEIIPCPREFDFFDDDWKHGDLVTYVEPMIDRVPLDGTTLPTNPVFTGQDGLGTDDVYHPIPSDGSKKIIFATSGSQVADYEDKARLFFKSMIAMMKTQGMDDYHLVLAVGDKLLEEFRIDYGIDKSAGWNDLPENVSISAWVSQLDILQQASAVFMHGGLATIKESIWEQVPLVIIPHGKDQTENAMRIRRSSIGIVPDVENLTPQVLRKYLVQVTTSKWIGKNLKNMHDLFHARSQLTPVPSVGVITDVIANPPTISP